MIYTISTEILDSIEKEFEYRLKSEEVLFIALVNSFTRKGQSCKMTGTRLAHECRCSASQISKIKTKLKKLGIITIYTPPNQLAIKEPDTIHFSKKTKNMIKSLFPREIVHLNGTNQTVSLVQGYNNRIGDSGSSFEEDPSSQPEEDLSSYLEKLNL